MAVTGVIVSAAVWPEAGCGGAGRDVVTAAIGFAVGTVALVRACGGCPPGARPAETRLAAMDASTRDGGSSAVTAVEVAVATAARRPPEPSSRTAGIGAAGSACRAALGRIDIAGGGNSNGAGDAA